MNTAPQKNNPPISWVPSRALAFKIALGYALLGAGWIFFSGRLLDQILPDPAIRAFMETIKGWFFVAVTALLLGLVLDHYFRRIQESTQRVQESEERFRALVDGAPDGVFVQSDGRVRYINPAMVRLLGASRAEELLGTEIMARVASEFQEAAREQIRFPNETGSVASPMDQEYLRLDGSRIPVETSGVTLHFQGHPAQLVFVRDRTARQKAEGEREILHAQLSQAQKMEAVGCLAGGVAHDFNNMLGIIIGHAEMALHQAKAEDPLRANLKEILSASQRSGEITRQLLAFARKQTIAPKPLDLNAAVESILKMLRRLIGENIDLAWHPSNEAWLVNIDPAQVDQVLANLCINARDAISNNGKITIEARNVVFDKSFCADHEGYHPGEFVQLTVNDDGCGMDKETRARIFEPFFTTKEQGKGTGLGLATVYGIVSQNGGFITVSSEPGKGSVFCLNFPRFAGMGEIKNEGIGKVTRRGHGETILLSEDEVVLRDLIREFLEGFGYSPLVADSPLEAIRLAQEHSGEICLLITDIVMPKMNGKELIERLRVIRPAIRCLFMSGYTADVIAHHGVLDKGIQFIQKPFSMKEFEEKIAEILDQPYEQEEGTFVS